jgi:hypothetical protein
MICNCTLCGEALTKPIFYKGNPYGWTCITKVNPGAKKPKKNANYVKGNVLEIIPQGWYSVIRAEYNGKKYRANYYSDSKNSIELIPDGCLINLDHFKK